MNSLLRDIPPIQIYNGINDKIIVNHKLGKGRNDQKRFIQFGNGSYDRVVNYIFSRDENKNKIRDGEKHALLYTDKGIEPAQFMGPGTHTYERIIEMKQAGIPIKGLTPADTASLLHDIQYGLAQNSDDIRKADLRLIHNLETALKNGDDNLWNTSLGKLGIQAKIFLEDIGIAGKDTFTTTGEAEDNVEEVYRQVEKQLIQDGYGRKRKQRRNRLDKIQGERSW